MMMFWGLENSGHSRRPQEHKTVAFEGGLVKFGAVLR